MSEYEQLVIVNGYDLYEEVDPFDDKWHDEYIERSFDNDL